MSITETKFDVVSSGQSYSVPGEWTAAQIMNMYSATIPGLSNMDNTSQDEGSIRTITFRPKTGTKG